MFIALLLALAPVTTPAPVAGVGDHIALQVADTDKSANFYMRYFGLRPIPAAARITTVRWLQAGPFQMHLIGGRTKPTNIPIDVHFALRVADLNAVITHLDQDKVSWSESDHNPHATQTRRDGVRQIYLQDPDGYWIEVNELPH